MSRAPTTMRGKRATTGAPHAAASQEIAPDFDIASVICAAERRRFEAFHANPSIVQRLEQMEGARVASLVQGRIGLMRHGYRVDPAITPKLSQLADSLRRTLRLTVPLDVFVQPDHQYNAFCLPSRNGNRLVMGLFSGLVSALEEGELLFVMGHELGHALLGHGEMVRFEFGHPLFSFLETHQLRGLARAREVSCDRVGLLACQDLRVATTAMFKVASGLNANWVKFDEEAYARHFDTLEDLDELVEADDSGGTHPPMPLRVKALVAFAHSEVWARAFGAGDWQFSAAGLECAVDEMMARVDPDLSTLEGADTGHAANAFIRAAALLVVAADGVVSPEEVDWLNRNTGGGHTVESVARVLEDATLAEQARADVAAFAELLRLKLPEVQRAGLLRAMCEVAACAGGIVDAEMLVLNELRNVLEVSMDVARDQLAEVRCGLGAVC